MYRNVRFHTHRIITLLTFWKASVSDIIHIEKRQFPMKRRWQLGDAWLIGYISDRLFFRPSDMFRPSERLAEADEAILEAEDDADKDENTARPEETGLILESMEEAVYLRMRANSQKEFVRLERLKDFISLACDIEEFAEDEIFKFIEYWDARRESGVYQGRSIGTPSRALQEAFKFRLEIQLRCKKSYVPKH